MKDLFEQLFVGFNGSRFYEAIYKGASYYTIVHSDIVLLSLKALKDESKSDFGGYFTNVKIEELEDIFQLKLYATYKGNEYETLSISPKMQKIELSGREEHEDEDLALGFVEELYYDKTFNKFISRDEVDSFRIERRSVYKEFLEKYAK